jgi:hypothetical protein
MRTPRAVYQVLRPLIDELYQKVAGAVAAIPLVLNPTAYWSQPFIFIDPVAGSDSNVGTAINAPLKHWSRYAQLLGTLEPQFAISVQLQFLNNQPDFMDPVILRPILTGAGASFTILGGLVQVGTDTIAVYTPRVHGPAPNDDTVTTTGGVLQTFPLSLVHDTNANAWFWVDSVSGGTSTITPPMNQTLGQTYIVGQPGTPIGAMTWETIANGDSLVIYNPIQVYIAQLVTQFGGANATGAVHGGMLQQIWSQAPPNTPPTPREWQQIEGVTWQMSRNDGTQVSTGAPLRAGGVNCMMAGGVFGGGQVFYGGSIGINFEELEGVPSVGQPMVYDGDIIVHGTNIVDLGEMIIGFGNFKGTLQVSGSGNLHLTGTQMFTKFATQGIATYAQGAAHWGVGKLSVRNGGNYRIVTSTDVTATKSLQITGGVDIDQITAAGKELSVYTPGAPGSWSNAGAQTTPLATLVALLDAIPAGETTNALQNPQTGSRICINGATN